jgi:HAMP domain-containing protein
MKIKISLLFKQALLIVAVMGVGTVIIAESIGNRFEDMYNHELFHAMRRSNRRFTAWVDMGSDNGLPDDCGECVPGNYDCCFRNRFAYRESETRLWLVYADNADNADSSILIHELFYTVLYRRDSENETWELWAGAYDNGDSPISGTPIENLVYPSLLAHYNEMSAERSGIIVGIDGTGERVGLITAGTTKCGVDYLLDIGVSYEHYRDGLQAIKMRTYVYVSTVSAAVIIASLLGLGYSVRYLKRIKTAVMKVKDGDYSVTVPVKGHDEITRIAVAFNHMSKEINDYTHNLQVLNEAYYRFLPAEILQKLGKDSVVDVKSGDNTSVSLFVMHISVIECKIDKVDGNDSDEFALFNQVSGIIMKEVVSSGGFAESGSQSGFICYFETQESAHKSAFAIRKELWLNLPQIKTAIAVVKGGVLIGVAGSQERLYTLSVSESIKLAESIAELGAECDIGVVCAENASNTRHKRYLGIHKEVCLYDCYAGESEDVFFSRNEHRELFESGVRLFEEGEYVRAKNVFIEYLKVSVQDSAAKRYLFLAERKLRNL